MLGAVMFGHKHFQPVIDAIIRLPRRPRRSARLPGRRRREIETAVLGIAEQELREAYKITRKQDRYAAVDAVKAKVMGNWLPPRARPASRPKSEERLQGRAGQGVRLNILDEGTRSTGAT
jgi:polyribonucleotide nucleotidyltransferase